MILITGAAGKTGRAIIKSLVAKGQPVRALIHKPEQVEPMSALGVNEVEVGNMSNREDMERAFRRIRAVYHICPNMCQEEVEIGKLVLSVAKAAGVKRFIYHSVLHPQIHAMDHHWQKMLVEELIFESGMDYTILQPAPYMQNILAYWKQIMEKGVLRMPYAVSTCLGMVDLGDVAETAAIVLNQSGHEGAIYELSGAERFTQTEIAEAIGRSLNLTVHAEEQSRQEWEADARKSGMSSYSVDTLLKMFSYYENYGFWGNPRVLTWLLGRPPMTFESFIQRVLLERKYA
jgi:NAD(P)H dehydrogenase (quinone)